MSLCGPSLYVNELQQLFDKAPSALQPLSFSKKGARWVQSDRVDWKDNGPDHLSGLVGLFADDGKVADALLEVLPDHVCLDTAVET